MNLDLPRMHSGGVQSEDEVDLIDKLLSSRVMSFVISSSSEFISIVWESSLIDNH